MADSTTTPTKQGDTRGVEGRVKEMVGKFSKGTKASTPLEAEKRRLEAQNAKAMAARYNMVLRGQQMKQAKMQQKMMQQRKQLNEEENHVDFLPHEFSEEWEDYPWHLAAAFADEDDAFWMPELALALEQEDETEINRAVLRFFLEENDPERLGELDNLLTEFAGNEEVLFINLNKEYNLPMAMSDDAYKHHADEIASQGTSTVFSGGEEEKSPDPSQISRRRPSYVVSGMRRESGWALNAADDDLKQKMEDAGADEEAVHVVVAVANANQIEPFAPGGVDAAAGATSD